jgi:hypothetical protein
LWPLFGLALVVLALAAAARRWLRPPTLRPDLP